jgi:thiol:disulfide interchange protein DsbC
MKAIKVLVVSSLLASLSFTALATEENLNKLKSKLESVLGINVAEISPSQVTGFYEVMTPRGLLYVSDDGRYLMQGSIYDLDNELANITEQKMATVRVAKLAQYTDSMIVFPAKNEKYQVTVFTDVDCGYCQRLHSQMAQYHELGITIRYLAFPRGGPRSPAWGKMQSLWCSDDKHQAMNDLKAGGNVTKTSCDNKVAEHYQLGIEFGVNGTPALVLKDGSMIPGYQPPEQLLQILKSGA